MRPEGARIYHRGREPGKLPLVVELEPGEKRVYEVSKPGYAVRRLTVDGSKPEVKVRLRKLPE